MVSSLPAGQRTYSSDGKSVQPAKAQAIVAKSSGGPWLIRAMAPTLAVWLNGQLDGQK